MTSRKLQLFLRFAKLGFFTLGGGYAMVPLIEREVVDRSNWMERDEYYQTLLLTQSIPGAVAVNTALVVGMHLEGALGGLLSALGVILPSFVIILVIAMSFTTFRTLPVMQAVFRGIRPAIVALIAVAAIRLARQRREVFTYLLAALGFAALLFLHMSPFLLVIVFIGVGIPRAYIHRRSGSARSAAGSQAPGHRRR